MRIQSACVRNKDLVLQMANDDRSLSEIGRKIGTTRHRVLEFLRKNGIQKDFPTTRCGDRNPKWRGGRVVDKDGYVLIYSPKHPNARFEMYVLEHRLVMEKQIGRYLKENEVVHHKDKNKQNNSPENLEIFQSNADHLNHELKGKIPKWSDAGLLNIRKGVARASEVRKLKIHLK